MILCILGWYFLFCLHSSFLGNHNNKWKRTVSICDILIKEIFFDLLNHLKANRYPFQMQSQIIPQHTAKMKNNSGPISFISRDVRNRRWKVVKPYLVKILMAILQRMKQHTLHLNKHLYITRIFNGIMLRDYQYSVFGRRLPFWHWRRLSAGQNPFPIINLTESFAIFVESSWDSANE